MLPLVIALYSLRGSMSRACWVSVGAVLRPRLARLSGARLDALEVALGHAADAARENAKSLAGELEPQLYE